MTRIKTANLNLYCIDVRRARSMGRGIPSELADTTKPGCMFFIQHIGQNVKTFLNLESKYIYGTSEIEWLKI
jgi:hypothetical protein